MGDILLHIREWINLRERAEKMGERAALRPPPRSEVTVKGRRYLICCAVRRETRSLEFGARGSSGELHFAELTETQLLNHGKLQTIQWSTFFSLRGDVLVCQRLFASGSCTLLD